MKIKKINRLLAATLVGFLFVGCGSKENIVQDDSTAEQSENATSSALDFQSDNYTTETMTVDGVDVTFRAYTQIVYVENPVDTQYQCMNVYIPEEYFEGESIGSFTAETAPIFLPNEIGQYLPAEPGEPSYEGKIDGEASRAGMTSLGDSENQSPNSILLALSKGYIVASPGARGRTTEDEDGAYTGKAPSAIVDLKAAVRYLHYNDEAMPGDADKIISNGTSAGGALSALLGATGDSLDYESYLEELGAADASDAIYAVSSYCPITNLENADAGYEWLFNGINDYTSMNITMVDGEIQRERVASTMTDDQVGYSDELKEQFITYVNGLGLKDENGTELTLDEEGNGTFKDYIKTYIMQSAQKALNEGSDLSDNTWITIENSTVTDIDFDGYIEFLGRSKAAPAFDNVDLSNPENSLFGTETVEAQHFTEFSLENDTTGDGTIADEQIIKMMNPMSYIGTDDATVAEHWRIRHGSNDSDTAISTPVILATTLESYGYDVDFSIPWGQGHGGDYDLEELFTWMNSIV